jgi:hypothetical protein
VSNLGDHTAWLIVGCIVGVFALLFVLAMQ